mgnify:CR=1 FL=1
MVAIQKEGKKIDLFFKGELFSYEIPSQRDKAGSENTSGIDKIAAPSYPLLANSCRAALIIFLFVSALSDPLGRPLAAMSAYSKVKQRFPECCHLAILGIYVP